MEKDSLITLVKNVDTQLFEVVHNLICSICQELFNKPVTTPCGHSFCNGCIKRVLSSKDNSGCPLCKNPVKRYGLEANEVKSTLSKICQELPSAFEKDVKELTSSFTNLSEDLISTSKLTHLHNLDSAKNLNINKQKSVKPNSKERGESKHLGNDSETFIPVLKRNKNVHEYASAKKKKMDDLVSISQTEPASNSSLYDSSELDKKLEKIEKVPPEEKVSEWFKSVGDNIYINSPSSILGSDNNNRSEEDKIEGDKPTMIRRDYNKAGVGSNSKDNICKLVDPYEFVPSQNNKGYKKKRQKRSTGKKIPDFKALQSFSKESIKRLAINLNESKEDIAEEEVKGGPTENQITASQKFDQLLSETKEEEKKGHSLFIGSQSSSLQFLDASFHSKVEDNVQKQKTPKVQKKLDDVLFKNIEQCTFDKEKQSSRRGKRRRSNDNLKSGKKKKVVSELTEETPQSEKSVQNFLNKEQKPFHRPSTKLESLLKELLDDDIIYATRPPNAPIRLPDLNVELSNVNTENFEAGDTLAQNTQLIGFCTQEETPDEKQFKQMVENMEKELNSSECLVKESDLKTKNNYPSTISDPGDNSTYKKNVLINDDESSCCGSPKKPSKVSITRLVEFLHLGKLTPVRKRTKSTVVKLVFPIGLTSLARRRAFESRRAPEAQIYKRPAGQKSMGIQTPQQFFSSLVQTSHVPQSSVNVQTSQEVKPSVEVQTTQKLTTSAEIQTSQRLVCQEIQTSQIACESAHVQTSQPQSQFPLNSNPTLPGTPVRKPSHQHRKIIQKNNYEESLSDSSPRSFSFKKPPLTEKDLIMDFGPEKEFEETWRLDKKHTRMVEFKNKKNKEKSDSRQKSPDVDSDDSNIQPPKRRHSFRIFSQEYDDIGEDFETRQLVPLDVRKVSQDEEMEVIDLDTPGSENSEEQMLRVLKNINLDLPKGKSGAAARGEKSEESDSDFFIEQTPPRPASRAHDDFKSQSKSRVDGFQDTKEIDTEKKELSEGTDVICDSIPKGFSESFQVLSAPKRISLTPEKSLKDESQRKTLKIDSTVPINQPDENDQNQLNSFEGKTKTTQLMRAVVDAWKQTEASPIKKLRVVASSVKNPDMINKFVSRFKIEYLNKPTKDMTHLIVGLHENEDKEELPLCTPKLLFAMANKKWVVNELWAETCLKMNAILPEDTFETLDPVGGYGCRKARLSNEKLLKNCEIFLLGEFQMMSKEDFADLIIDCGGTLVPSPEKFSFLPSKLRMMVADRDCLKMNENQLQELYQKYSSVILSRDAIIMSVQSYNLVNLSPYLLHSASEECLVKLGYPLFLVRNEDEDEDEEGSHHSFAR